ncbi:MAG: sulfotransferase [Deltaproteobacteria bacterium]|jgi:hypothetical protein
MLRRALRRAAHGYLSVHHRVAGVPEGAVLVLGHMRSGSTLLLHLLMAHPDIMGAGERNATYASARDFDRLARDVYLVHRRAFGRTRYVADQLNHDHLIAEDTLLLHHRVCPVLLVRDPAKSIGSMVRTFESYGGWTPKRCADYYVERVDTLTRYAELLRSVGRAPLLVTYEALVDDPVATLEPVRAALELRAPFSSEYGTHRFTGVRGDPSKTIQAGRVKKDSGRGVELDSAIRERAEAARQRLLDTVHEP